MRELVERLRHARLELVAEDDELPIEGLQMRVCAPEILVHGPRLPEGGIQIPIRDPDLLRGGLQPIRGLLQALDQSFHLYSRCAELRLQGVGLRALLRGAMAGFIRPGQPRLPARGTGGTRRPGVALSAAHEVPSLF